MDKVKSKELFTGNATIFIPVNKKYAFKWDAQDFLVTDQDDLPIDPIGKSPGVINIKTDGLWNVTYQETNHHVADPIPVETDIGQPDTDILSRMRALIQAEVMNRYGSGSDEVESLEEALNFDIDNDGHIGSPYELPEEDATVEPEVPADPPPEIPPAPTTEPEPEIQPPA